MSGRMSRLVFSTAVWSVFSPVAHAGPFAPAAEAIGSTAISKDDPRIVAWADRVVVSRGPLDISDISLGVASFGPDEAATGPAEGTSTEAVSLGDAGSAVATFAVPVFDGPGFDFAVFENGFGDAFLELGFVEVSSDGVEFFRFDAVSLTPTDVQIGGFDPLDPTDLHNLAGKYRQGFGTPFDLAELAGASPQLDIGRITHVRIVDVVGSIDDAYATVDSAGRKINDPWPTPFASCGFDLDAIGVLNAVGLRPLPHLLRVQDGIGLVFMPDATDTYIHPLAPTTPLDQFTFEANEGLVLDDSRTEITGSAAPPAVADFESEGGGRHRIVFDSALLPGEWLKVRLSVTGLASGRSADLTIWLAHQPLDLNQDGQTTIRDATAFGNEWHGMRQVALLDFDGDGSVSVRDATAFGDLWRAGWAQTSLPPRP